MAALSLTDAALEGFRIPREQPRAVLIWAGVHLVFGLVISAAMITVGGNAFTEFLALSRTGNPDPQATMAAMRNLGPTYAVLLPLGLMVQAVFSAAIYRVVLRPQEHSLAYLRLGADELRLALVILIYIGLAAMAAFMVTFVGAFVAAAASAVAGPAGALVGVPLTIAGLAALIYLGVRFSLAPVQTFAERKLRLFDSWTLTKGHFWPLAGAYLLAGALTLLVVALSFGLFSAAAAALHGGDAAGAVRAFSGDMSSLQAYFTPATLIYIAFSSLLNALYYTLLFAPGAVAYRQLAHHGASEAFA